VPISNANFPSNWELSAARAGAVVRLFIDAGVPAPRMSAVGHADNIPVAANSEAEGRARNRRVAVTILSGIPDPSIELRPDE
ncbi:MAG: OmpA family protein, partial [Burkholderiaceae bacterium]|nr:OmpA family protein [Burkholderiaceae bacterium]